MNTIKKSHKGKEEAHNSVPRDILTQPQSSPPEKSGLSEPSNQLTFFSDDEDLDSHYNDDNIDGGSPNKRNKVS